MYPLYQDIRDRLGEPLWHDGHGVPRYDEFHPDLLGIYDKWALEMNVTCQYCGRDFLCCNGIKDYVVRPDKVEIIGDAASAIDILLGWGDAPWHTDNCGQCPGTTMRTDFEPVRLWRRESFGEWEIVPFTGEKRNAQYWRPFS